MCSADLMNSMIYCDIVYLYCCRGAFVNEDSTHHHPQAIYQTISKVPACVEESLREVLHISDDIFWISTITSANSVQMMSWRDER